MANRVVGVIGGSGVYELSGLTDVQRTEVETPFGAPSDALVTGLLGDTRMVFLPRHGTGHRILPHEINYRANIFALKTMGVEWLISLSAVGSMKDEIRPGDLVIVDQFFDRTHGRPSSFFGGGIAGHVGMADPVSPTLARILFDVATERAAATGRDVKVHRGGTYLVINGPQFSTRGESNVYRQWGVSVIGMTNMPEAKLAREAEISYATIALSTDYDCWHDTAEDVSVAAVLQTLQQNSALAKDIVAHVPARLPSTHDCIASSALESAIMTSPEAIPDKVRKDLAPILGKYYA